MLYFCEKSLLSLCGDKGPYMFVEVVYKEKHFVCCEFGPFDRVNLLNMEIEKRDVTCHTPWCEVTWHTTWCSFYFWILTSRVHSPVNWMIMPLLYIKSDIISSFFEKYHIFLSWNKHGYLSVHFGFMSIYHAYTITSHKTALKSLL